MTDVQAMTAISSLFSIALLCLLWLGWRRYRVDSVCQDLFFSRHVLFDIARQNPFLFQHPVYRQLRGTINNSIRFAHKFTFTWLLIAMLLRRFYQLPSDNWQAVSATLPPGLREELDRVRKGVYFRISCHLLYLPIRLAWALLDLAKRLSLESAASKAKLEMKIRVEMMEVQTAEEARVERESSSPVLLLRAPAETFISQFASHCGPRKRVGALMGVRKRTDANLGAVLRLHTYYTTLRRALQGVGLLCN